MQKKKSTVDKMCLNDSQKNKNETQSTNFLQIASSAKHDEETVTNTETNKTVDLCTPMVAEVKEPKPETKVSEKDGEKKAARFKKWKKRMRFQPKNVTIDTEKQDYYKKLLKDGDGESFELPRTVSVMKYAEESKKEIEAMLTAIKQHAGSKTALQVLPRHMRRRAASHNIKRLPNRLRELALQQSQQTVGTEAEKAKICRKKRRRKVNLQNEFAKRAGKQGWLETHLWHAKRFHMSETTDSHFTNWKNRVPVSPSDKSFRACYRAVAKHCLIQDISYMACVRLTGTQNNLRTLLSDIVLKTDHDKIFSSKVLSGEIEISTLMTSKENGIVIGPISLMCEPSQQGDTDQTVWCWLHPAIFKQASSMLEGLSPEHGVLYKDISSSLNRFRLYGPKSSVTLLSVLQPFAQNNSETRHEKCGGEFNDWISQNQSTVTGQHYKFVSTLKELHRFHFYKDVNDSYALPPNGEVIPVVVNDPRLKLPLSKEKPIFSRLAKDVEQYLVEPPGEHSRQSGHFSPLWNLQTVEKVAESRLPDHVVSTRKNQARFSSDDDRQKLTERLATPVPVLLIRMDGLAKAAKGEHNNREMGQETRSAHSGPPTDFASGWDLILPKNWATAFWIPFVYHLARAGGLREREHTSLECKVPHFPRDFPDTEAGKNWWQAQRDLQHSVHYKKPPAKRVNYSVLASPSPFAPNWNLLFSSTPNPAGDFPLGGVGVNGDTVSDKPSGQILVSDGSLTKQAPKRKVSDLDNSDDTPRKRAKTEEGFDVDFRVLRDRKSLIELLNFLAESKYSEAVRLLSTFPPRTLICVQLTPIGKGTPEPPAMICQPGVDDLLDLERDFNDPHGKGLLNCSGPVESKHWHPNRKARKLACKEEKEANEKRKAKADVELKATASKTRPLCFNTLPSRQLIGFVTSGDFLFSYAAGGGVGLVCADRLGSLLKAQRENSWLCNNFFKGASSLPLALMRNVDSTQYRFVLLKPI